MWQIRVADYQSEVLTNFLNNGWEPFAITCLGNASYALVWLRKKVWPDWLGEKETMRAKVENKVGVA